MSGFFKKKFIQLNKINKFQYNNIFSKCIIADLYNILWLKYIFDQIAPNSSVL